MYQVVLRRETCGEHWQGDDERGRADLPEAAREEGLVRIEISPADGLDLDTSAQLTETLGLTCWGVLAADPGQLAETTAALGRVAAQLLAEILSPDDVLGPPWSRSVLAMTAHLGDLPAVRVVQLSGAMEMPGMDASAVDIVRAAAKATGGAASIFHAPFVLDDIASSEAVRRQSSVAGGRRSTAVRGGLVNGLVVDGALARALLAGGDAGVTARMP